MNLSRLTLALTVVNLALLGFLVLSMSHARSATALMAPETLRGRTLELVDDRGVVRARLGVKPASTAVELDLFDRKGIVHVKLGAGDNGSGLLLTDEVTGTSSSYVQIIARHTGTPEFPKKTSITLHAPDGRERVLTPP